jgi:hypothetical protein
VGVVQAMIRFLIVRATAETTGTYGNVSTQLQ